LLRGDFHAPSGFDAATRLLQLHPRPTALFVCNDMMAIGALHAAAKLGLRVPEDVAIVGFDDIELAHNSSLTPYIQPKPQIDRPPSNLSRAHVKLSIAAAHKIQIPT
jgi:LacI family transcriptional regulator